MSIPRRVVIGVGAALVLVAVAYLGAFVAEFQLLGLPVRDEVHGWLGPTPRNTSCVVDIGKVNSWQCDDITVFRRYRFGCQAWLWAMGLGE
jgi:hypothetical protein